HARVQNPDIAVGSVMPAAALSPSMSVRAFHAHGKRRPIRHETIRIWERGRFGVRRIPTPLVVRRHGKSANDDGAYCERSSHATGRWQPGAPSESTSRVGGSDGAI